MNGKIIALVAMLVMTGAANAEMSLKDYQFWKDKKEGDESLSIYVAGMGDAIKYTNAMMNSYAVKRGERVTPLFCLPGKLTVRVNDYFTILNQELEDNRMHAPSPSQPYRYKDDDPIPLILVAGFINTFPCK